MYTYIYIYIVTYTSAPQRVSHAFCTSSVHNDITPCLPYLVPAVVLYPGMSALAQTTHPEPQKAATPCLMAEHVANNKLNYGRHCFKEKPTHQTNAVGCVLN